MKRSEQAERIHHTEWLQRWADAVADDEESALVRNLSLAILLVFVCAVALWLLAWAVR